MTTPSRLSSGSRKPGTIGSRRLVSVVRRVEGQTDVKRDALALRLDLDTGSADLLRSPMDANSHASPRPFSSISDGGSRAKPDGSVRP